MIRLLVVSMSLVACSASGPSPTEAAPIGTGDLGPATVTTVVIDGREHDVAVVTTAEDRSRGLRGVTDLGDLDGMLFTWGGETVASRFTMADTLIPLDIAFFDDSGAFVDGFTMVPCDAEPCPGYASAAPYAYALESPAGTLPGIAEGSVLVVPG